MTFSRTLRISDDWTLIYFGIMRLYQVVKSETMFFKCIRHAGDKRIFFDLLGTLLPKESMNVPVG